MKTYYADRAESGTAVFLSGSRAGCISGRPTRLRHVVRHSPTGLEWGYGGSGPADLALSILTDAVGPKDAERWYMAFKREVVAGLAWERWEITEGEIRRWLDQKKREVA